METVIYGLIFGVGAVLLLLMSYAYGYNKGSDSAKEIMNNIQFDLTEKLSLKAKAVMEKDKELISFRQEINALQASGQTLAGILENEVFFANEFKKMHDGMVKKHEAYKTEQEAKTCGHVNIAYDEMLEDLDKELKLISNIETKLKNKKAKSAKSAKRKR